MYNIFSLYNSHVFLISLNIILEFVEYTRKGTSLLFYKCTAIQYYTILYNTMSM